jgi:hypothetical protein
MFARPKAWSASFWTSGRTLREADLDDGAGVHTRGILPDGDDAIAKLSLFWLSFKEVPDAPQLLHIGQYGIKFKKASGVGFEGMFS